MRASQIRNKHIEIVSCVEDWKVIVYPMMKVIPHCHEIYHIVRFIKFRFYSLRGTYTYRLFK